jgi:hypothetical protein
MSTTLEELAGLLKSAGIRHGLKSDHIRTGFETDLYEDTDGENCVHILLRLEEDGEILRIQAPAIYRLPPKSGARRLAAVQRTLNQLNWETKTAHYEMDTDDGEIRLCIDLPLEDAKPTEQQLARAVRLVPLVVDQGHLPLRRALDEGVAMPHASEILRQFETYIRSR